MKQFNRTHRYICLGFLGLTAGLAGFVVLLSQPSFSLEGRNGLRARILMPSRFRAFAVEDLARRGDVFGYSFELDRSGLKRWTLNITTQGRHRAYWEDAFEAYAREQQLSVTTRYDRGSRIVLKGYGANRAARCWLSVEESPVDGEVELAYVYQVIPSPTGLGRYLRSVTFYIQRCCRLFRGQSVWTDLDTRAT